MKARFKFYDDPDKMETEIRKYIHQGSSISEAKKIMEQNGLAQ